MSRDLQSTGTDGGQGFDAYEPSLGVSSAQAAVLVVSRHAHLLYSNRVASGLVAAGSLISLDLAGRLKVFGSGSQRLEEALNALSRPETVGAVDTHAFAVIAGDGTRWRCNAVPFDPRSLAASPAGTISGLDDRALLVTFTPQQAVVGPVLTAMQQFGLTLAEAEVALALSLGLTPQEIADQRVASIHTVRNQIKAILAKTHSRRQADIARLVVRLRH